MEFPIKGKSISLRPMAPEEIPLFYQWATQSEMSVFWYPKERPSYQKFLEDWRLYYFNGSEPENGRCFMIEVDNKPIGAINYNGIDKKNKWIGIDIIIGSKDNCGHGYGSDAIKTLVEYLFKFYGLNKIFIEVHKDNVGAKRACEKAGFHLEDKYKLPVINDYFNGDIAGKFANYEILSITNRHERI